MSPLEAILTTACAASAPSVSPSSCVGGTIPADVILPGKVLFDQSAEGDVHTIFLLNAGCEKQLTEPGAYGLGRVSPDHRRILVMPSGDIPPPITGGTIDLEGKHFERLKLTDPTLNLVPGPWSPDGSRIAFEGWDDSDPTRTGVYTAQASDGGDLVRITTRPGLRHDIPLDYSPDGSQLVFYRSVHVDPDPHVGGSLWVVGVDGKGRAASPDTLTQRTGPAGHRTARRSCSPPNAPRRRVPYGTSRPAAPTW